MSKCQIYILWDEMQYCQKKVITINDRSWSEVIVNTHTLQIIICIHRLNMYLKQRLEPKLFTEIMRSSIVKFD